MTRRALMACLVVGVPLLSCGGETSRPEPPHCGVEPLAIDFGETLPPLDPGSTVEFTAAVTIANEILVVSGGDYEHLRGTVEVRPATPAVVPPSVRLNPPGANPAFDIPAGEEATFTFSALVRSDTSPGTHRGSIVFAGLCDSVRYVVRVGARPEDPPRFVAEWGEKGDASGQLQSPVKLAFDDQGLLCVSDPGNRRVQVFRTDGTVVRTLAANTSDPRGIAVDGAPGRIMLPPPANETFPDALVYVADAGSRTVKVLDRDGSPIKVIGDAKEGRPFGTPWGCVIAADGNVLVLDRQNSWVAKVDIRNVATQKNLGHWGEKGSSEGQLFDPIDIAGDPAGALYILDGGTVLVNRFTPDGTWLGRWGGGGSGPGEFIGPQGIGVDAAGNVFVADSNNARIQKLTSDGTFLTSWGDAGSGEGQFIWPVDVEVGSDGRVYVLDRTRAKVLIFAY